MIKDKILKLLKDKRLATSRVASKLNIDYAYTLKNLIELELEGKVEREVETLAIYWILTSREG